MGYSSVKDSVFNQNMPQTKYNAFRITEFAGWSFTEAAFMVGVSATSLIDASIPENKWRQLVDMCGKRAFDYYQE